MNLRLLNAKKNIPVDPIKRLNKKLINCMYAYKNCMLTNELFERIRLDLTMIFLHDEYVDEFYIDRCAVDYDEVKIEFSLYKHTGKYGMYFKVK